MSSPTIPFIASSNSFGSVVLCGRLSAASRAVVSDCGINVCFSRDLKHGLQIAEQLAPAILLSDENDIQSIESNVLHIALALMPSVRVMVLVSTLPLDKRRGLLRAGVSGLLEESTLQETWHSALERVAAGEIWASRQLLCETLRDMVSVIDDPRFTRREIEILRCVAAGDDNRHIAEKLFIARETVRWHLRSAYSKLGIHSRHGAAELMRNVVPIRT